MSGDFGQAGLANGWGRALSLTGVFKPNDLRVLQAAAITTVEDFLAATIATPGPMADLLGTSDLAGLQADLAQSDSYAAVLTTATELSEAPLELGALAPDDIDLPQF